MNIHSANISSAKPIPVARHLKSNVEEIKFATSKSELGTVLVARSAAGVCAILIGNRADVLKRDLAGEFTDAKLVHDDRALRTDLDRTLTSAARYSRDSFPAARLGRPAQCSGRLQDYLRSARLSDWRTARDPCRRECLRGQRNCAGYPVSSCGQE